MTSLRKSDLRAPRWLPRPSEDNGFWDLLTVGEEAAGWYWNLLRPLAAAPWTLKGPEKDVLAALGGQADQPAVETKHQLLLAVLPLLRRDMYQPQYVKMLGPRGRGWVTHARGKRRGQKKEVLPAEDWGFMDHPAASDEFALDPKTTADVVDHFGAWVEIRLLRLARDHLNEYLDVFESVQQERGWRTADSDDALDHATTREFR